MSEMSNRMVAWLDGRLDELLAVPRMWGSSEAVELQTLLLLEARLFALGDEPLRSNPRYVLEAYLQFLRSRFPKKGDKTLDQHVGGDFIALTKELVAFRNQITSEMPTSDVAPAGQEVP